MKIALIAPPWFPVPPSRYGGIEWIVWLVAEGLTAAGNEVTLFATGESSASATLEYYSALPINITSGLTTVQGTAARPVVNGVFIPRNAGTGGDFFTLNARIGRAFALPRQLRAEVALEGFNITNRENVVTRNTNFGAGSYPDSPLASFGQITGVGDPRSAQIALRLKF